MQDKFINKSELQSEEKQIRLQVYLSHCGVASRRASEKIIQEGRVSVNGQIVRELGTKVSDDDDILVDGKKIRLEENKRYVLLNKPAGFVCSSSDEKVVPVHGIYLKKNIQKDYIMSVDLICTAKG